MKQYNGEKAIISLTSWKARINTVSKTLYSLLTMCPGFHIVLCLSEEEFPKKEAELPAELVNIVGADLIELLWVYKNYKAFKKVLFTMDKYRDIPVISADDDCIYKINYAEELYKKWLENPNRGITCTGVNGSIWGYATLHTPNFSQYISLDILDTIVDHGCIDDDSLYNVIQKLHNMSTVSLNKSLQDVACLHDCIASITSQRRSHKIDDVKIYKDILTNQR